MAISPSISPHPLCLQQQAHTPGPSQVSKANCLLQAPMHACMRAHAVAQSCTCAEPIVCVERTAHTIMAAQCPDAMGLHQPAVQLKLQFLVGFVCRLVRSSARTATQLSQPASRPAVGQQSASSWAACSPQCMGRTAGCRPPQKFNCRGAACALQLPG